CAASQRPACSSASASWISAAGSARVPTYHHDAPAAAIATITASGTSLLPVMTKTRPMGGGIDAGVAAIGSTARGRASSGRPPPGGGRSGRPDGERVGLASLIQSLELAVKDGDLAGVLDTDLPVRGLGDAAEATPVHDIPLVDTGRAGTLHLLRVGSVRL